MPWDPATDGWEPKIRDDFPNFVGPIWERREAGCRAFGFLADARHANDRGVVHGGMVMTFADHSIGELVLDAVGRRPCATIQLNTHFLAAVQVGDFVAARGRILRQARDLLFMQGLLAVGERHVASVDGIWKVLRPNRA